MCQTTLHSLPNHTSVGSPYSDPYIPLFSTPKPHNKIPKSEIGVQLYLNQFPKVYLYHTTFDRKILLVTPRLTSNLPPLLFLYFTLRLCGPSFGNFFLFLRQHRFFSPTLKVSTTPETTTNPYPH